MFYLRVAIAAALLHFSLYTPASAQDITLKSPDGAVEISGDLLGFDGEFYRVQTVYGELTVDGTGVNCDGPACPNLTDFVAEITLSGARSMADVLMPALIEAFALRNGYLVSRSVNDPNAYTYSLSESTTGTVLARFHFRASTTDEGFADLLADEADITMALREVRPAEALRGYEAGLGDLQSKGQTRLLALDALVPIVSPDNPIRSISPSELSGVFSGVLNNWAQLGGADAPISLHLPRQGSGMLQAVEDELMLPAQAEFDPRVEYHDQVENLVNAVERDPFAIGIGTFATSGQVTRLPLSGGCGFSVAATRLSIKTEDYPLTAPIYLYLPARRLPKLARNFLSYIRGPAAQIVMRRAGFVDHGTEEIPISQQGERLANAIARAGEETGLPALKTMVARLSPLKRLTTTFRFKPGVAALDAHSISNILQLAAQIEQGEFDGREIVFVGFSDGEGPAEVNQQIAMRRADAARKAVVEEAKTINPERIQFSTAAFGEALPMACDENAWGRLVNRRVEVWLR